MKAEVLLAVIKFYTHAIQSMTLTSHGICNWWILLMGCIRFMLDNWLCKDVVECGGAYSQLATIVYESTQLQNPGTGILERLLYNSRSTQGSRIVLEEWIFQILVCKSCLGQMLSFSIHVSLIQPVAGRIHIYILFLPTHHINTFASS